jgi:DNA-binding MarR family transcriptional regulator
MLARLAGHELTIGELAEPLRMSLVAASKHVQVLERAGLVRRTRDGADRRRVTVTADADELWRRVGPSYERIATSWNAFLDTLTDEQLEVADTVLRQASELNALEIRRLRGSDDADR